MSILTKKDMRVIVQGITGREAANFVKDSLNFGTDIVAGVTPGKGGETVHGVSVFNGIREIPESSTIDCSIISVPPAFVKDAAWEAIENGIKLIVIVTERVPRQDVVQILTRAKTHDARIVGPNSLGIISPQEAKIAMMGGPLEDINKSYQKGCVGIISRSGGMSTEIANLLTCNGLGQSTIVSIGGDPIIGSRFLDLVPLFATDPQTQAVVLYGEPGGCMEEDLASYLLEHKISIPIVAFVSGRFVDDMEGVRFGHAGAIVEKGKGSTKEKIRAFTEAGVWVADQFSDIPNLLKEQIPVNELIENGHVSQYHH